MGTSLTTLQASQLADLGRNPIIATDNDLAGRLAAERDFWLLTPHGLDPTYAQLPAGSDPADLIATGRTSTLNHALTQALPLAEVLINERLGNLPPAKAALEAIRVLAAQPPTQWEPGLHHLAEQASIAPGYLRAALRDHVRAWNTNPRRAANTQITGIREVHQRQDPAIRHGSATRQQVRPGERTSNPSVPPRHLPRDGR